MNPLPRPKQKIPHLLNKALLLLVFTLVGVLAIGTIYALARSRDAGPVLRLGKSGESEQPAETTQIPHDETRVFSGIRPLRIQLSNSSIMILSIAFPYNSGDIAFTEELAGKVGEFRNLASGYFSSLPPEKLIQIDEEAAKMEILKKFNADLRLGRIETLFFSDLMIIDAL